MLRIIPVAFKVAFLVLSSAAKDTVFDTCPTAPTVELPSVATFRDFTPRGIINIDNCSGMVTFIDVN
ncbi:hypothetical protein ACG2LH_16665 [Zhouia sp. PK063]